jgi:HSP20 family protein
MAKKPKGKAGTTKTKGGEVQPARRAMTPFEEMEQYFERLFPGRWFSPLHWERPHWPDVGAAFEGRIPRVDIIDRDDEIIVHAEIPGVDKDDLDISLTDNTLTIRGSTKREEKEEKGDYHRSEITRGAFTRTISLPGDVDPDKAEAGFKDGMLELKLPKVARSKRRSVKIR